MKLCAGDTAWREALSSTSRFYRVSREKEFMLGTGQAVSRLLMWKETWAALGVGAGSLCREENDKRQECCMWGLSFLLQQSRIRIWPSGAAWDYISWEESEVAGDDQAKIQNWEVSSGSLC